VPNANPPRALLSEHVFENNADILSSLLHLPRSQVEVRTHI